MSLSLQAYSARTKFPNTPETDLQSQVMHIVTLSDGSTREVMARDPMDAIERVNQTIKDKSAGLMALWMRVIRAFGNPAISEADVDNAFTCLADADCCLAEGDRDGFRQRLNRACQWVWGSCPPGDIQLEENWTYSVKPY